jgi:hypothetical protein
MMQRVDISGNVAMIKTVNAQECVENVIFEIVCICNLKSLIIAEDNVVIAPSKYVGKNLGDVINEQCRERKCLLVNDGHRQYLLVFFILKMGLGNLVDLINHACNA